MLTTRTGFYDELAESAQNPIIAPPSPRAASRTAPVHKFDWSQLVVATTEHRIDHELGDHHHPGQHHEIHGTQAFDIRVKIFGNKILDGIRRVFG